MNAEDIRKYCLNKSEVTESLPFNDTALVFKVNGKMFMILDLESELRISLKCDPDIAVDLRERFNSVYPGYHLNKRLWNTINNRLIIEKMPKRDRQRLLPEV